MINIEFELDLLRKLISDIGRESAVGFNVLLADLLYVAEYGTYPVVVDECVFTYYENMLIEIADMLYPEDDDDDGVDKGSEQC